MGIGVAPRTTISVKNSRCNGYKNYSKEHLWLPDSPPNEPHILHGYNRIYGMCTTDPRAKKLYESIIYFTWL